MNDRRQIKRRHLLYYLRVFDRATGEQLGHMVDITPEGLQLISEHPIEPGSTFQMSMDMPEERGSGRISFDGVSMRCEQDVNPRFYLTGFKIHHLDDDNKSIINQLIALFGFQD
jgi:hypothetical protein